MSLIDLGWSPFFEATFAEYAAIGLQPARVTCRQRTGYDLQTEQAELQADVTGGFRHKATGPETYPTVGDWVAVEPIDHERSLIHAVLPRRTAFIRKATASGGAKSGLGRPEQQVLAANVDIALLVTGLDNDYNVRRIERYLSIAWDSGAEPIVVLNKADLCDDVEGRVAEIQAVCFGVPVIAASAVTEVGIGQLKERIKPGLTLVLLGSSGVGKSSIINTLLGSERQEVGRVRHGDGRGRHTTTYRELIRFPDGGMVIDTPGMREIHAWEDQEGLRKTFADIEELAVNCRFADCSHRGEPGCAVMSAIESGDLTEERYQSYLRLEKEMNHLRQRQNERERRAADRAFGKKIKRYKEEHERLKRRGMK
ncbi:MAG TPA: ribosome small subunit-dependent GTPase A [candidate division Zixibacteria bacterium]|nr:ribosome small subunit-dependent GTPase A [candidate division Zixibacteria bacterium]